jgi:hypothetical protein
MLTSGIPEILTLGVPSMLTIGMPEMATAPPAIETLRLPEASVLKAELRFVPQI